jgi:hypothetical protein
MKSLLVALSLLIIISQETFAQNPLLGYDVEFRKIKKTDILQLSLNKIDSVKEYNIGGTGNKHTFKYNDNNLILTDEIESLISGSTLKQRYTYDYDSFGNPLSIIYEQRSSDNWELSTSTINKYDSNNNLFEQITKDYIKGEIKSTYKYIYNFNENNRLMSASYLHYKADSLTFGYRYEYTRNIIGLPETYIYEIIVDNIWTLSTKITYSYNDNDLLSLKVREKWVNAKWKNDYRSFYYYDDNKNIIFEQRDNWVNDEWKTSNKITKTYNQSNYELTELSESLKDDKWVIDQKVSHSWNDKNNLLQILTEVFIDGAWYDYGKVIYSYNNNDNLTGMKCNIWNGKDWENSAYSLYFYESGVDLFFNGYNVEIFRNTQTDVDEKNNINNSDFSIFPNPAADLIEIKIDDSSVLEPFTKIEICNLTGKIIETRLIHSDKIIIDLSNIQPGMYYIKINNKMKKFIKD